MILLLLYYYYYYYMVLTSVNAREKEVEVGLRCNTLLLGVLLGPSEVFSYAVQEFRRGGWL